MGEIQAIQQSSKGRKVLAQLDWSLYRGGASVVKLDLKRSTLGPGGPRTQHLGGGGRARRKKRSLGEELTLHNGF